MRWTGLTALFLLLALLLAATALADVEERFARLVEDFESHELAADPIRAGRKGDLKAAARWPDNSFEAVRSRQQAIAGFLERLRGIPVDQLPASDQISHAVMDYLLSFRHELASFEPCGWALPTIPVSSRCHCRLQHRPARPMSPKPRPGLPASTRFRNCSHNTAPG